MTDAAMTPAKYIRTAILGLSQAEMGRLCNGVDQSTVSRWEKEGVLPPEAQRQVREAARDHPGWSDSLFFELPEAAPAAETPEAA